jgi:hypothetical protein
LRQALPDRHWSEIRAWRDDRLYVTASSFDPLAHWRDAKTSSFLVMPTELTAIHSEPHLDEWFAGNAEIRCIDGPGWLVKVGNGYIEPAERRRRKSWRLWLSDYLGTDDYAREGVYVCFCSPDTGALLSEFDDVSPNLAISPDGRRIACLGEEGMIELWDSAAPRRWPWTLGLGLAVAGTMLYLNRKRSARQSLQAASSQLGTVKSPDPSAA